MARTKRVNARIQARHIAATDDYLSGMTYAEVARRHGYAREAGARWAVNAELKRRRESNDERRDVVGGQLQKLVAAYIGAALAGRTLRRMWR